jgi:hypothetical protein
VRYTQQPEFSGTTTKLTTAARILIRYPKLPPEIDSLTTAFRMSRATAYRWQRAWFTVHFCPSRDHHAATQFTGGYTQHLRLCAHLLAASDLLLYSPGYVPGWEKIAAYFGVSKATAYRYRATLLAVSGMAL